MKKALCIILAVFIIMNMASCIAISEAARLYENAEASASLTESEEPAVPSATAPAAGVQEATICVGYEPDTLDPNISVTVDGMIYITHLYEGLYRPNTDGTFSLGQASDVKITENLDGTAHVVATLREGVQWSDGKAVTAYDFEYSWKRLCDPATDSEYAYIGQDHFANGWEVEDGEISPDDLCVTAIDDNTLEFDLVANVPYIKDLLAFPSLMPLREDIVAANPEGWAAEARGQVFNGRYLMTAFEHGNQIVLMKNEHYWDAGSTRMDKLNFLLSGEDSEIYEAFKAGNLDFCDSFPVDELEALSHTPEYHRYGQAGLYYLEIQQVEGSADVLKDENVRRALSLAIDRAYLNETIWADSRFPAYALVPYGISDATVGSDFRETAGEVVGGGFTTDYEEDVALARQMLAEAGYEGGEGFPKLEYVINENAGHQAVAEAVQQMWEENLGIETEILVMDWDTLQEYRKTSFCDIARQGWIGDYTDPATFFDVFTTYSDVNDGHYSNPDYDELVTAARNEADPAVRMEMYHQAEAILMDDMPIIPIVYYADDVLAQTYFTGFGVTGTGLKMFWDAQIAV